MKIRKSFTSNDYVHRAAFWIFFSLPTRNFEWVLVYTDERKKMAGNGFCAKRPFYRKCVAVD